MNNVCPVCGSSSILKFLEQDNVPVHQNYILRNVEKATNIKRGNLSIYMCNNCGFIFNKDFDINKLNYGCNYDNTQDLSGFFKEYIKKEIDFLTSNFDIKNSTVIEVGCGKGKFLEQLVQKTGCKAIGFDPSYEGKNNLYDGKLKFIKEFYDGRFCNIKADIVICRHVIEHIPKPLEILTSIKKALRNSQNAIVFFETPSVKWILEENIIYDFFYEHCSYFEDVSVKKSLNLSGFKVLNVVKEFKGQYMWVIAGLDENSMENNSKEGIEELKKLTFQYSETVNKNIEILKNKIASLSIQGKVAVWGAGAKGVTFINLIDPNKKLIDSAIDINKNKQGCYIPGSAHEIVSYEQITKRNIKYIIVMNQNYYEEIDNLLMASNIKVNLISGEKLI
ncbi:class I SAM-dependent methyltransferase [Clostridium sp. JS66]|uniref:class I SAM-dependent methyltransferase n=1 Tax=Clostridium sp. JS66 TaxID=3064705 RepID=UPI00298E65A4|nr:class I SAM-dependent methyltransferase [Clostridium sp. JS66]WPC41055.1 class I SAM-dependent methyltransferase [Clostridium sp. JS66]